MIKALSDEIGASGVAFERMAASLRSDIVEFNDSLTRLRDDCKEALVREVRSRMETDTSLHEALEQEAKARVDAIKVLQNALSSEVRQVAATVATEAMATAAFTREHVVGAGCASFLRTAPTLTPTVGSPGSFSTTTLPGPPGASPSPGTHFRETLRPAGHQFAAGAVAAAAGRESITAAAASAPREPVAVELPVDITGSEPRRRQVQKAQSAHANLGENQDGPEADGAPSQERRSSCMLPIRAASLGTVMGTSKHL